MSYTPFFEGLFNSDAPIFAIFSLFVFAIAGYMLKTRKRNAIGLGISVGVYVICAILVNVFQDLAVQIIGLVVGAIAFGAAVGFIIGLIFALFRREP